MDKDLNIHAKITDAELAKQQLEQLGKATEDVGQRARQAEKTSGQSTDETNQKLEKKKGILDGLKNQVTSLIGGYFGFQAVITLISGFIAKLERVQQLQREIYERSLQMGDVGQRLEIQTGTTGKQNFWAKQALELQKAGGLRDINAAAEMMVSGDIAFSGIGGIKDKNVRQLLTQIAPVVGAAGLGGQEVAKAFEFAGAAGIAPNAGAYKKYFAQLRAGFTASKATDFGQFMVGLQQGATGYMAQGGSLEQAISLFTGARSVSANEALSATLIEQSTRFAFDSLTILNESCDSESSKSVAKSNRSTTFELNPEFLSNVASGIPLNVGAVFDVLSVTVTVLETLCVVKPALSLAVTLTLKVPELL